MAAHAPRIVKRLRRMTRELERPILEALKGTPMVDETGSPIMGEDGKPLMQPPTAATLVAGIKWYDRLSAEAAAGHRPNIDHSPMLRLIQAVNSEDWGKRGGRLRPEGATWDDPYDKDPEERATA